MRKGIIFGIGILIILLALAGTGGAFPDGSAGTGCSGCHTSNGSFNGTFFDDNHKFNGISVPNVKGSSDSCNHCHIQKPTGGMTNYNMSLTSNGSLYNSTHRYDASTLASVKLIGTTGCYNCHVNASYNDFTLLNGTPSYLTSSVCEDCHKAKYDNWTNTLHRVMLTPNTTAQAMGLPTPEVGWTNISYVIVTKFAFAYINLTGYFPAQNDTYNTETKEFENGHNGSAYGTCGRCHTTGWNTSGWSNITLNGLLPGINGTFSEPGIACERCHKPAGNGHQVVINYSGDLCRECHTGGNHGTGWENGEHAPPAAENGNCMTCHSPFDKYSNPNVTVANTTAQSCGVCHNIHNMTDNKYADTFSNNNFSNTTWSVVADAKLSFFNATASLAAATDVFDDLISNIFIYPGSSAGIGTGPINLTGHPVSEVLCSKCHYNHGLAHMSGVNLTHGVDGERATCTDCHMQGANASVGKDMMKLHANDPLADVSKSCGNAGKCHTTSAQNLSASNGSIVPIYNEWYGSAHNDKVTGTAHNPNSSFYRSINGTTGVVNISTSKYNSCLKCHSPIDWNPSIAESNTTKVTLSADFKGITCEICHNLHDMGDWLIKTQAQFGVAKPYAWYNRDGNFSSGRYKANYTLMANTTELCGNCHSNIRYGKTGPGWSSATSPISPHGFPAKDIFVGSWKQSGLLKFECKDCHMYINKTNATGVLLDDANKTAGHSFAVNTAGLQNKSECSGCHVNGTSVDTIENVVAKIQADTQTKWNATNITVQNALTAVLNFNGVNSTSRDEISQAYWKLKLVSSDESWGVHDPVGTNKLLDDAVVLANASIASLGQATSNESSVDLVAGWNLVALNGTPSATAPVSVLLSVHDNVTVVWGYNATAGTWELYDPAMVPTSLNTLTAMVPGKGYWILATQACEWTI